MISDKALPCEPLSLRINVALTFAVVCLMLSSCSKIDTLSSNSGHTGANSWTIAGVVRLAVAEEPNTLVRMFSNQSSADDVTALLFEPFFRYDDNMRPVPALAMQFPTLANGLISKDGLRVTFNLRPKAVWSDGEPVTSADVIFTWHAIVDGNNPVVYTAGYDKIKTITAGGPHRVTFVLKQPFSPSVYLFSEGTFSPLPAHLLAKHKTIYRIPYDAAPIGDGPFVLKQWLHGSELVFAANERYWRGAPHVHEIHMIVIPDPTTQLNELRTHEIDLLEGVSKPLVAELRHISGIRVQTQLADQYRHLDFNVKRPILADANVRRAIARAVNVPRIIATVYAGHGVQAVTDIPPFSWAADDLKPIPYDLDGARRLLDASGWVPGSDGIRVKNGERLALSISSTTNNRPNASAEALASQELKSIGVDLSIKNYAGTVLFAPNGPLYGGTYDMSWIVNTNGVDPDNLAIWGCDYFPPHGGNTNFYCNHEVDGYLRAAQRTYDQASRRRYYKEAWRIMLDEVPSVMIYWDKVVSACNRDLKNFKPSPVITNYWNAWEWEI
ncbi:MAG TPA: peptide ABC transporter substrate-binding protein [Candidatus Eremiobacteraceae bacterium]|nr:peptide ABC transporter substrate-binding protein [Candidatus Eremiobacteraceae bacterium]